MGREKERASFVPGLGQVNALSVYVLPLGNCQFRKRTTTTRAKGTATETTITTTTVEAATTTTTAETAQQPQVYVGLLCAPQ